MTQDLRAADEPTAPATGVRQADRDVVLQLAGWELLSPYGDRAGFRRAMETGASLAEAAPDRRPETDIILVPGFDVREALGKKGTRSFDRHTGLFVKSACNAIEASGLTSEMLQAAALINGTATGSLASIQDFLLDTYRLERPYFVNPAHMPNTVINCAAGQCAIWHRIRGPNATLSAGAQSFFAGLRLASRWARQQYASHFLVGAVEEVTPITEKLREVYSLRSGRPAALTEGAAAYMLTAIEAGVSTVELDAVLATRLGTTLEGDRLDTLSRLVDSALGGAGVSSSDIKVVVTKSAPGGVTHAREQRAISHLAATVVDAFPIFGRGYSVSGAMQLALLLHRLDPGQLGVAVSASRNGSVACTVVRRGSGV